MHPAGSDGKMVLPSGAVYARPRLSRRGFSPPDPEPLYNIFCWGLLGFFIDIIFGLDYKKAKPLS